MFVEDFITYGGGDAGLVESAGLVHDPLVLAVH